MPAPFRSLVAARVDGDRDSPAAGVPVGPLLVASCLPHVVRVQRVLTSRGETGALDVLGVGQRQVLQVLGVVEPRALRRVQRGDRSRPSGETTDHGRHPQNGCPPPRMPQQASSPRRRCVRSVASGASPDRPEPREPRLLRATCMTPPAAPVAHVRPTPPRYGRSVVPPPPSTTGATRGLEARRQAGVAEKWSRCSDRHGLASYGERSSSVLRSKSADRRGSVYLSIHRS